MKMKMKIIVLLIFSSFFIFSCHSSGKGTPLADPPDASEQDTVPAPPGFAETDTISGLEASGIYLENWGDCEDNDWIYIPPVHNAYYQEDGDWKNVELHGYLRKLIPYVYLDIQTWTQDDDQFSLNVEINLSEEINYLHCNSCIKYFDRCNDIAIDSQECETVYWATEGTLTITARDTNQEGSFEGTLTNAVFKEIKMPLSSSTGSINFVENGQEICIKQYDFNETIEEYF